MSNYTNKREHITQSKGKTKKALATGNQLSLRFSHADLVAGNDVIGVTQSQLNRLNKAHETGKGVTIKCQKDK